jgi:hypothetical protein
LFCPLQLFSLSTLSSSIVYMLHLRSVWVLTGSSVSLLCLLAIHHPTLDPQVPRRCCGGSIWDMAKSGPGQRSLGTPCRLTHTATAPSNPSGPNYCHLLSIPPALAFGGCNSNHST